MQQTYQDVMALNTKFGHPDLFITFICNPSWKEIKEPFLPGETFLERPDLVARVFRLKLKALMDDFRKNKVLGKLPSSCLPLLRPRSSVDPSPQ